MYESLHELVKTVNAYYAGYAYEVVHHLRSRRQEAPPETRFLLFGRGRSGTTLLLSLLDQHPKVDCDGEILRRRVWRPRTLLDQMSRRSRAPVYGCKLLSYQLRSLQTHLSSPRSFLEDLVDEGYRLLYLRRRNLFRHALSGLYAERRRQWHQTETEEAERPSIYVPRSELFRWLDGSARLRRFEHAMLEDLPHLSLMYEDHLEQASAHADTLQRVTDWLDLRPIQPDISLQKTTPRALSELATNPNEIRRWVEQSPYAQYLPTTTA